MNKFSSRKGFTLIEITLVLGLTLGLAAALIFGMSAFQRGSDRAKCLLNISNVQKAVRSWANLNEVAPNTPNLPQAVFPGQGYARLWGSGQGAFLGSKPICPRDQNSQAATAAGQAQSPNGNPIGYTVNAQTTVPQVGTPYLICTLSLQGNLPVLGVFHDPCDVDGVKVQCRK